MSDRVRDYLRSRGYPQHVVSGGFDYLARGWERTAASVARGKTQYHDDYLNDADVRHILEEVLELASPDERERVRAADRAIRPHLVPSEGCIWGKRNEERYGYARDRDWWYYHRPENVDETWPNYAR